ncbi:MAG: regulatory protein RecX [Gammaproteobacteria bacterium]
MNETAAKIREACLRLLASREHSKKELRQKMVAKGFGQEQASPVIEELVRQGWLSESRFAESFARSKILKGYGPVHIAYELRLHGVKVDNRTGFNLDVLADAEAGGWMAHLERVYLKKYGDSPVSDRKEWARRCRFLLQRGFTQTMIADLADHLNILSNQF